MTPTTETPTAPAARAAGWSLAISDALTVGDLVRLAPSTLGVLSDHGIEPCCGGARTLADLARRHQLALDALLDELRVAAEEDAARGAESGGAFGGAGASRPGARLAASLLAVPCASYHRVT